MKDIKVSVRYNVIVGRVLAQFGAMALINDVKEGKNFPVLNEDHTKLILEFIPRGRAVIAVGLAKYLEKIETPEIATGNGTEQYHFNFPDGISNGFICELQDILEEIIIKKIIAELLLNYNLDLSMKLDGEVTVQLEELEEQVKSVPVKCCSRLRKQWL